MMIKWVAVVYLVFPIMETVVSILRKKFFGTKQLISIGQGLLVISVPAYLASYIESQLTAAYPKIVIQRVRDFCGNL